MKLHYVILITHQARATLKILYIICTERPERKKLFFSSYISFLVSKSKRRRQLQLSTTKLVCHWDLCVNISSKQVTLFAFQWFEAHDDDDDDNERRGERIEPKTESTQHSSKAWARNSEYLKLFDHISIYFPYNKQRTLSAARKKIYNSRRVCIAYFSTLSSHNYSCVVRHRLESYSELSQLGLQHCVGIGAASVTWDSGLGLLRSFELSSPKSNALPCLNLQSNCLILRENK